MRFEFQTCWFLLIPVRGQHPIHWKGISGEFWKCSSGFSVSYIHDVVAPCSSFAFPPVLMSSTGGFICWRLSTPPLLPPTMRTLNVTKWRVLKLWKFLVKGLDQSFVALKKIKRMALFSHQFTSVPWATPALLRPCVSWGLMWEHPPLLRPKAFSLIWGAGQASLHCPLSLKDLVHKNLLFPINETRWDWAGDKP